MAMSVKNAFVERFGIPADWDSIRLRDLGCFIGGGTPESGTHAYWDGDIPWLTPTEMTNIECRLALTSERKITQKGMESARCSLLQPGTLIITTRGTVGNVVIAGEPLTCNQSCEAFVPNDKISSDYLYFLLTYWRPLIERLGAGTTFKSITRRDIQDLCFVIPQRGEQESISAILVKVDDALAAVCNELKTAQCLKTALMQQLFTKGIPGRHKDYRKIKRGLMPADWQMKTISQLADVTSGFTMGRDLSKHKTVTVPYVTVVNVQDGFLNLSNIGAVQIKELELDTGLLKPNDVLMTEGGDRDKLGRGAIWTGQIDTCAYQNHIFRVRFRSDEYLPKLFHYLIQSWQAKRYFYSHAKQTSNLCTINSRELRRFPIGIPDSDEQEEIVEILDCCEDALDAIREKIECLEQLKKSLLQNLLTGRVRVNTEAQ